MSLAASHLSPRLCACHWSLEHLTPGSLICQPLLPFASFLNLSLPPELDQAEGSSSPDFPGSACSVHSTGTSASSWNVARIWFCALCLGAGLIFQDGCYSLPLSRQTACSSGAGGMISAGDPQGPGYVFTRALHKRPFDEASGISLVCRWRRRPTQTPLASGSPPGKALVTTPHPG